MTKDLADELERLAKALFDEPDAARRIYRSVALSLWVENNLPRIISALRREEPASLTREGEPVACPACYRGEVFGLATDDGFWVEMGASAGGAHEHGMNGWLELIEHNPDGTEKRREYVATDSPIYTRPQPVACPDRPALDVPALQREVAGIIVRDVLQEDYDDLVEGYLDEIMRASLRIIRLPGYSVVARAFETNLSASLISAGDELDKAKAENARMREALEMIADGSAPPIPHGQYLAHRPVMDLARQALVKAG